MPFLLNLDTPVGEGGEGVTAFADLRSKGDYPLDELASWLQKSIRRGDERGALFAATELDLSGYSAYTWRRLEVIASEDVGLAWLEGPAVIAALRESFERTRKHEGKERPPERSNAMLFLVHATLLLARARKSRAVDDACMVFYVGKRAAMNMTVPDYALDGHTRRGRALGRTDGDSATYDGSYALVNEAPDVPNPFHDEARALDLAPKSSSRRRRLLGALHREYARLSDDPHGGDGRVWALMRASEEFGRLLESSRELSDDECAWLLERLRAE